MNRLKSLQTERMNWKPKARPPVRFPKYDAVYVIGNVKNLNSIEVGVAQNESLRMKTGLTTREFHNYTV
jgi:hypothetical protein